MSPKHGERLQAEKKAPGYVLGILKAVKSALRYNDLTLTGKVKVSNATATHATDSEQIPS